MNTFNKFSEAAIRGEHVVGHLKKGTSAKFTRSIFQFLKGEDNSKSWIDEVTGKRCNLGDGEGMQVLCLLDYERRSAYIDRLQNILLKS